MLSRSCSFLFPSVTYFSWNVVLFFTCIAFYLMNYGVLASISTVPKQEVLQTVFSGTQWPYVYSQFMQSHRGASDIDVAPMTSLANPAAAAVANILASALSTPPSVTGLDLRDCQFLPNGLTVVYVVTRFSGNNELSNTQIESFVRSSNVSALEAVYWRYGGHATESLLVLSTQHAFGSVLCNKGCEYAVGITIPLFSCAILCIPILISLVSRSRSHLQLDDSLPVIPSYSPVYCSRHAMTPDSSYADDGAEENVTIHSGIPEVLPDDNIDEHPAGCCADQPNAAPNEKHYPCSAQEPSKAEHPRRKEEGENTSRRANGLSQKTGPMKEAESRGDLAAEDTKDWTQRPTAPVEDKKPTDSSVTGMDRQRMALHDTGMIGGEILTPMPADASLSSEVRLGANCDEKLQ